jgi:hypothetical protein
VLIGGESGQKKATVGALSTNNDWAVSGGTLYLYSDTDATLKVVEATTRVNAILCEKDYVTISDFEAYGANGIANVMVRGGEVTPVTGIVVSKSEVHHGYYHGIYLYNAAESSAIANNCYSHWDGFEYGSSVTFAHGINVYGALSQNINIQGNIVDNNYCGIWVGNGVKDARVTYNIVRDNKVNGIDIYQNNAAANPALVYNNLVIHNPTHQDGHGHGIDIQQSVANGIVVKNNIMVSSYTGATENCQLICLSPNTLSTAESDYNVFYRTPGCTMDIGRLTDGSLYSTLDSWKTALAGNTVVGKDAHSIEADPMFVDFAAGDYRLQSGSPCIGAGTPISGLTTDYAGNAVNDPPSIGALEYVEST